MDVKKNMYFFLKIMIILVVACSLTYKIGKGTLAFKTLEYDTIQNFEIINAELLDDNTVCSKTNDSQLVIRSINNYIRNVLIMINESSQSNFLIQVFYDTGNGFNEDESSTVFGKKGDNLVTLNDSKRAKDIRIDITNLNNHQLTISKIIINKFPSPRDLTLILIFNIAFLIFFTFYCLNFPFSIYSVITLTFYTIILYIADTFFLTNKNPIYNILFFIVVCLLLIMTQLIRKVVNNSADEKY